MSFFDPFIVAVPLTYPRLPQNYIRTASASFNMAGNATRNWVGERKAPATLNQLAMANRSTEVSRSSGAGLELIGDPNRVYEAYRSSPASLAIEGTPSRALILIRSAAGSLAIIATGGRVASLFRAAIASMEMAGTATRGWIGARSASATLSMVGAPSRVKNAVRSAAASLGMAGAAARAWVGTRKAPASFNIVAGTIIYLSIIREVADEILSDLQLYLSPYTKAKTPSSSVKVNNYTTSEAILGANTSGKMVSASADNVDVLNTTGDALIKDLSETSPRLGTSQKIPKGYRQGGRAFQVTIYVLGRNTVLDAYMDEDGDSTAIAELRINGVTKDGDHCNYYVYDAMPYAADALMGENGGVFAYRFVAARIASQSQGPSIKLIAKTASAPMTVNLTHPQVVLLSTALDVDVDATTVSESKDIQSVLEVSMS